MAYETNNMSLDRWKQCQNYWSSSKQICLFCMIPCFLQSDADLIGTQNKLVQERKVAYCDSIADVIFASDKLDEDNDADMLEALKDKFEVLHEMLYTDALINKVC